MTYLISKIVLCLVVAFLLGALVGWFLSKLVGRKGSGPDSDQLKRKLDQSLSQQRTMEVALEDYESRIAQLKEKLDQADHGRSEPDAVPLHPRETPEVQKPLTERSRPLETDDLKAIRGIGPAIEEKLNAIGIRSYRQISELTASDVERVAAEIKFFPDRIHRDGWIDQAADLHYRKYGN
jgi:predicted flap endonuclease-1-like 5' DNA nuclease